MKATKWLLAVGVLALAFAGCTVTETEYVDRVVEKEVEKSYAAAPAFTVGDYDEENGTLSVSITTATEDATICYTTDGSDPTTQSTAYETAITVSEDTIIKAFAAKSGMENSPVSVAKVSIAERQVAGEASAGVTAHDAVAVYHWQQDTSGVAYTNAGNTTREVAAGTKLADLAQTFYGFTAKGLTESKQADGTYIVHVWYDRNIITYTYYTDATETEVYSTGPGLYDSAVTKPQDPAKAGAKFVGWLSGDSETKPPTYYGAESLSFHAQWKDTASLAHLAGAEALANITLDGTTLEKTGEVYVMDSDETAYAITGKANAANYAGVFISGRTVTLSPFIMGKYEVTQELYSTVMKDQKVTVSSTEHTLASEPWYCTENSTAYALENAGTQKYRPVEGVTWYDAVYFCNALSEKLSLDKAYTITITRVDTDGHITAATVTSVASVNGYRLPTEAEWEFAARGGNPESAAWDYTFSGAATADGTSYGSSRNAGMDGVGWYCYNNKDGTTGSTDVTSSADGKGTHEVGLKAANALGIYDMSGNVWEWCYDWYSSISTGSITDPSGASSGSNRVSRGGSWYYYASNSAVSYRDGWNPYIRDGLVGFRLVRSAQ